MSGVNSENSGQNLSSTSKNNGVKGKNDNPVDNTNLYVKGLWKDCTQIELDDLFKPFGVICQSRVYGDGIGFVRYELPVQATTAINALNGQKAHVKSVQPLIVRLAHKKSRLPKSVIEMGNQKIEMLVHENTKNIYIRGLPLYFTESDLFSLCSHFGTISCIRLCKNGVAFVRYSNGTQACNAIHGLHGKNLGNCFTPLLVKLANSDPFEPRIEFRPHEEGGKSKNLISQGPPQLSFPVGLNQMKDTFNNLNIMNLGNCLAGLNLAPSNSTNLINVPNVCNPQLQNQYSNTSVNSLNLNLLCGTNNNMGAFPLTNNTFGITQQLLSSSIGLPVDPKIKIAASLNQNIQKENQNSEEDDTDNHDSQNEEDDGNDEIVYLGYEEEEEKEDDEEQPYDSVIESKNANNSPKSHSVLEKNTSDISLNKNSIPVSDATNNTSFSSSICSLIPNNTSNVSVNNIATPTLQINVHSDTNQNFNTNPFVNLNSFVSATPLPNLNYTNWPQYAQPQQGSVAPLSTFFPALISMASNSSEISNASGNFGYFPIQGMQPGNLQMQQIQFPQNLKQEQGSPSFLPFVPTCNLPNNATLSPTSNVNFPLNLPLLQNSNSFQFYIPNQTIQ